LLSSFGKLFTKVINNRLNELAENYHVLYMLRHMQDLDILYILKIDNISDPTYTNLVYISNDISLDSVDRQDPDYSCWVSVRQHGEVNIGVFLCSCGILLIPL